MSNQSIQDNTVKSVSKIIFNMSNDPIVIIDFTNNQIGNYLSVNDAYCKQTGFVKEDRLQNWPTDLFLSEFEPQIPTLIDKLIREKQVKMDIPRVTKDGTRIYSSITAQLLDQGEKQAILVYIHSLEQLKAYFEIFKESPIPMFVLELDGTTPIRFIDVNDAFCTQLEYTRKELLSLNPFMLMKYPEKLFDIVKQGKREGKIVYKAERISRGGKVKNNEVTAFFLNDKIAMVMSIDVTKQTQMEHIVHETEERYRTLIENIPAVTWISDENGVTIFISPNVKKITGYTPEEIYQAGNDSWFGRIHPDDHNRVLTAYNAHHTQKHEFNVEYRYRRKDGEYIWINDSGMTISKQGKKSLSYGFFLDITEHKKAEEIKILYKQLFENVLDGIAIGRLHGDRFGRYLEVNEAFCHQIGHSRDELLQSTPYDILPEEDLLRFPDLIKELSKNKQQRFEAKLNLETGEQIISEITASLINISGHDHVMSISRDITERKKMEEALRIERDVAQKYLDIVGVILVALDTNQKISLINKKGEDLLGYKEKDILGKNWFDYFIPQRIQDETKHIFDQLMLGEIEPVEYFENPIVTRNGEEKIIAWRNTFLQDDSGNIIGTLSSGEDITERKKIENLLKQSEEKYRMIIETAQEGIFLIDQDTKISYANQQLSNMLRFSLDNLINSSIFDFIDQTVYKKAEMIFKKDNLRGEFELKFRRRDGTEFWGLINTNPMLNDAGNFIGTLGMVIDISERKIREDVTNKQLMKFNILEGEVYLVTESAPVLSIRAFEDLLKIGYPGLVISRTLEQDFQKNLNFEYNFLWLAQQKSERSIRPDLAKITSEIENQKHKSVILLDRLDYLIQNNGFSDILHFVYDLKEIAYLFDMIIIISIDVKTLTPQQLSLLTKETKEINPRSLESVPEEKLEILRFIYKKNNSGVKPSYTDISNEFIISRPTTRKRLKSLVSTGYLHEYRIGIRKTLEVTSKGRSLFLD